MHAELAFEASRCANTASETQREPSSAKSWSSDSSSFAATSRQGVGAALIDTSTVLCTTAIAST